MSAEPEFRGEARHIPWEELEPKGATLKVVDGQPMDREQYDVEDWRFEGSYSVSGSTSRVPIWRAPLGGLRRYAALRRDRKAEAREAYRDRVAEEDSFREYVDALDDAKPQR